MQPRPRYLEMLRGLDRAHLSTKQITAATYRVAFLHCNLFAKVGAFPFFPFFFCPVTLNKKEKSLLMNVP
jgi:hypothetical protein